jgi:NAD(P)-dependent dehydrogenase (short-subunit alcohol dehydrogenase family)
MRLKDRIALITGGGSGIGEATALRFAREGAKIAICDVDEDSANRVAQSIKEAGGESMVITADVSNRSDVEAMVSRVVEHFGRVDILVNNAGINRDAFVKKMTEEQWDDVIRINLKGTFLCAQAAFGVMSQQKYGKIINTASIGAVGNIGQANYAASKCGVIGFTKTLALEGARYNINVNCVAPGATKTPMTGKLPEKMVDMITAKIPFGRWAEPDDIASAHVFFASDEAGYVTGQVLFVDGGITTGL